ncbi:hypothetical protein V6N00_13445 [Tersicoccus sp. MR15.9]
MSYGQKARTGPARRTPAWQRYTVLAVVAVMALSTLLAILP